MTKFNTKIKLYSNPSNDSKDTKKIMVVYQDCYLCGSRRKTIPPKIKRLVDLGYEVLLMGFTNPAAKPFIAKAVELGIGSMPFYTDGEHFASTINEMIDLISPKKSRKIKKTEEIKDGPVPEV